MNHEGNRLEYCRIRGTQRRKPQRGVSEFLLMDKDEREIQVVPPQSRPAPQYSDDPCMIANQP